MAADVRIWFSNSLSVVIMLSSLDTREISVNASLRFRNMHTLWEANIRSGNGLIVASYLCCHLAALVHNELMSLLSHHCMFVFVVVHSHVLFKIGLAAYFLFWYFWAYLNINYSFLPCLTPTLVFTAENHLVFFSFRASDVRITGPMPFISVAILCQHSSIEGVFAMDECLAEPDHTSWYLSSKSRNALSSLGV